MANAKTSARRRAVESGVARMRAVQAPMWDIVEAIHDHDAFDVNMFGKQNATS